MNTQEQNSNPQANQSIEEIKEQIIEEFSIFDDWMDKYDYLIEQGKSLNSLPEEHKTKGNLIEGCQSNVWLRGYLKGDKLMFEADSDAIITKGLIALLIRVFSNQSPGDIEKADTKFIDKIGLKEQLSPTRSNGLMSMIKQMKLYATVLKEKLNNN